MRPNSPWLLLTLIVVAAGLRSVPAVRRAASGHWDTGLALAVGHDQASPPEEPRLQSSAGRIGRKLADAHLLRVRRTHGSGPGGFLAPALETPALATPPFAPLQLLPSPACIQDRLDRCTRSPRPPPQV